MELKFYITWFHCLKLLFGLVQYFGNTKLENIQEERSRESNQEI